MSLDFAGTASLCRCHARTPPGLASVGTQTASPLMEDTMTTTRTRKPKTQTAAEPEPTGEAAAPPVKTTKLSALMTLLRRPEGARIAELCTATGWQAHSVRGAIAGTVKKKLGLTVSSDASEAGRVYRMIEASA